MTDLNWITEFKHEQKVIIHIFSNRVKAIRDMGSSTVRVYKDGSFIRSAESMTPDEYETFLIGVAKDAATIQQFESHD